MKAAVHVHQAESSNLPCGDRVIPREDRAGTSTVSKQYLVHEYRCVSVELGLQCTSMESPS